MSQKQNGTIQPERPPSGTARSRSRRTGALRFLLGLPFTVRFSRLDGLGRTLYQASLLCAAVATALLVSPVAYHRWVFRRHEKGRLLRYANIQAILGLAMVAVAACAAVWMVLLFVGLCWPVGLLAAATTGSFPALWFVLPVMDRIAADR